MWLVCSSILNILQVFNDATHTFSSVYKPNSHQFLIEAMNVAGALLEGMKVQEISYGVLETKNKWLRYYKYIPEIYLVTMVFDPSCKFDGLIECLEKYYELLGLGDDEDVDVAVIITKARHLCNELCETYVIRTSTSGDISSTIPRSSSSQQYVKYGYQFFA